MSVLEAEILILTDTDPGLKEQVYWDNAAEVAFKDAGSRRAALVSLAAFGTMAALRAARRKMEVQGKELVVDGKCLESNYQVNQALGRIATVQKAISETNPWYGTGDSARNWVQLQLADADLLVECMEMTATLSAPDQGDDLGYYAAVMPTLIEEAQLSAQGSRFRYEI